MIENIGALQGLHSCMLLLGSTTFSCSTIFIANFATSIFRNYQKFHYVKLLVQSEIPKHQIFGTISFKFLEILEK